MIIAVRIITFIGFHLNREFHYLPHAPGHTVWCARGNLFTADYVGT